MIETKKPHHSRSKLSRDDWETPPGVFNPLNEEFQFTIDICADQFNAKCPKYYTKEDNALIQDWGENQVGWLNPPYSEKDKFIEKTYREIISHKNLTVVLLIPDTTDITSFHQFIFPFADEIRFCDGRVQFIHPITKEKMNGNTRGSVIVIFRSNRKYLECKYSTFHHYKITKVGLDE